MDKTYLSAVQCKNCNSIRNYMYTYPAMEVKPFPEPCKCNQPEYVVIAGYTPQEWFEMQKNERGTKQ